MLFGCMLWALFAIFKPSRNTYIATQSPGRKIVRIFLVYFGLIGAFLVLGALL